MRIADEQTRAPSYTLVSGQRAVMWLLGGAIVLIELVHLLFLTRYPLLFIDESWNANAAWTWLTTGVNFDAMHAGTLDRYGYEWLRWPALGNAPWLATLWIFGLNLFAMRIVSWIFGILLLIATFFVAKRCAGTTAGLLAALFLSLSQPFLVSSHMARWDVQIAAIAMAALFFALKGFEHEKWYWHVAAGLLIGASADVHMNGLMFAPALIALYLAVYQRRFLRARGVWMCALGGVAGIGFFLVTKVLVDPEAYASQFAFSFLYTHRIPIADLSISALLESLRAEIRRYHFFTYDLEFVLIGASVGFLALRGTRVSRLVLLYGGIAALCFTLFVGNKSDYYAIILYPYLVVAVGSALALLAEESPFSNTQVFIGLAVAMVMLTVGGKFAQTMLNSRTYDYELVQRQVREFIPSDSSVMAQPMFWLGMDAYDFVSSKNLTYMHFLDGTDLEENFEALRPDYVVVDGWLRYFLEGSKPYDTTQSWGVYNLPKQEFDEVLEARGRLVTEMTGQDGMPVEVYEMTWE